MVDLFKKQRVTIYEIEEGVDFNIGTMPNVTIGSMPNVTVTSMPNVTIDTMPNVTIGTMPNVIISTMPNVTIGSMPNVVVASGSITVGSGTITVDGGDINIASKYNMAKWGTTSIGLGNNFSQVGAIVDIWDDDSTTYSRLQTTSAGVDEAYYKWDLGAVTTIKTLLIYLSVLENGGGETITTKLRGSDNDSDWTDLDSTTVKGTSGNGTYDNLLAVTKTHRYFQLIIYQTGSGTASSLFVYDAQLIL